MIPDIGLMVAAYIVTRMFAIIFKDENHLALKIFAVITILVATVCAFDLLMRGTPPIGG